MDQVEEQLQGLNLLCSRSLVSKYDEKNAAIEEADDTLLQKKIAPCVPPKPQFKKKTDIPQVPQSRLVAKAREPLYSQPLQVMPTNYNYQTNPTSMIPHKHPHFPQSDKMTSRKSTLDNPAILQQQLEALAYHKQQMEKKGLLAQQTPNKLPSQNIYMSKLSLIAPINSGQANNYCKKNHQLERCSLLNTSDEDADSSNVYNNTNRLSLGNVYTNLMFDKKSSDFPQGSSKQTGLLELFSATSNESYLNGPKDHEEDVPPPPSPVSSSYSELRRATNVFDKQLHPHIISNVNPQKTNETGGVQFTESKNECIQQSCNNDYTGCDALSQALQFQISSGYYGYGDVSHNSSTYDSIYEPINPRTPSGMSLGSNGTYVSYINSGHTSSTTSVNLSTMSNVNTSGFNTPLMYSNSETTHNISVHLLSNSGNDKRQKNEGGKTLCDYLVRSMDPITDSDNFGKCFKCNEGVVGEKTGCTAMDHIYHISCFTCCQCQINLQGKPFYALDGQPYCEYDYLQTLEKCSVCMKPILERILRATGKPYHPQCFTCVVCGHSLDGIPFTVDATNQNYCITDFHKKFAPRCCVCKDPIMPETGQEETVRVVALDRSFHLECYKCEDCGLLLSSESEGRGCYPLDDHVLCKSCNAKRVQILTKHMTTEL